MELVVCSVDHRHSPLELRERLSLAREAIVPWLAHASRHPGLGEAAILSTCNRTEVYGTGTEATTAGAAARALLAQMAGSGDIDTAEVRVLTGVAVLRHAMRVACGLESLVPGERQILGQVRDAYALAREAGSVRQVLDRLFMTTLHAAKRVHTETDIGSGSVSVASAAIVLAEKVLGDLAGRSALVVGAGAAASLVARHLAKRRLARLLITNRTRARAEALAAEVAGVAIGIESIGDALATADLVICATRAESFVITGRMVAAARAARGSRPLVLVDIAMPRGVDPAAARADNVFVYPIDALSSVVDRGLARRQRGLVRAEAILDEEEARFAVWLRSQAAIPLVRELRQHFERVRVDEVKRSLRHFSPDEQPHLERVTRALVKRLLQAPTLCLKNVDPAAQPEACWADAVRGLFALEPPPDDGEGAGAL